MARYMAARTSEETPPVNVVPVFQIIFFRSIILSDANPVDFLAFQSRRTDAPGTSHYLRS